MKFLEALKRHKWRYLAITAGFALFLAPIALFTRIGVWLQGSGSPADIHDLCYRMPFSWLVSGNFAAFDGRYLLLFFTGSVLVSSFFFGPVFCGWLCPVGSSTELLSRGMPRKLKIDFHKKASPTALRYGFLGSFLLVSALAVFSPATGLGSICCRYCSSTQIQNIFSGIFNPTTLTFWSSGSLMVLGGWLLIGGVFWQGGRGWCLYGCPLGAVSNAFHAAGSKLDFTYKIKHDSTNCLQCGKCEQVCPSWALTCTGDDVKVNRNTCTACLECVKVCDSNCISYKRGKA